jgi:L-lactate dehydrogenase (cytochrome)
MMIISAPADYREAARRRLPRLPFEYIDATAVRGRTMTVGGAEARASALQPAA